MMDLSWTRADWGRKSWSMRSCDDAVWTGGGIGTAVSLNSDKQTTIQAFIRAPPAHQFTTSNSAAAEILPGGQ